MPMSMRRQTGNQWMSILVGTVLSGVLLFAWRSRDYRYITPEQGLGYYLGIIGGLSMLALLLYPLRKRRRSLAWMGSVRSWFKIHQFLGLFGPTLVILHSNFGVGSVNGQVALASMLIVAFSGLVGRYLYGRSHHGLLSQHRALNAMASEREGQHEALAPLFENDPALAAKWQQLQIGPIPLDKGVLPALRLAWAQGRVIRRLRRALRRALQAQGHPNMRQIEYLLEEYARLVLKMSQFALYERLLSLWHLLHMPLFILLIITATFHVVAVHMY